MRTKQRQGLWGARRLFQRAALLLLLLAACTSSAPTPTPGVTPTATPSPTAVATPHPTLTPSPTATPIAIAYVTPPERDLVSLAKRLVPGFQAPSQPPTTAPPPQQVGTSRAFWVIDLDKPQARRVEATLALVSEHVYWYVEQGIAVSGAGLSQAAQAFEQKMVPALGEALGRLWAPGPDGDPRLTVLHARFAGAAGYYSSGDQYPAGVSPFSNERAIIYLKVLAEAPVGSLEYLSTLAHELQHAIHWATDPTEETWVGEGLSEVIKSLLGYPLPFGQYFDVARDRTPFMAWPTGSASALPYYGGATRFFQYLMSHYGGAQSLGKLIAQPQNGIAGIDAFLQAEGYADGFDDLFKQWAIANALDLPSGPYSYPDAALPGLTPTGGLSDFTSLSGVAPQYTAHYVRLTAGTPATLRFEGATETSLLPTELPTPYCWWSNRGDTIDSTLTHPLDLREVSSASLQLTLWYDIEEGWDYAYVEASADGGATWDVVQGERSSSENPVGNAFGPGYSGSSGGWVTDQLDLSAYAGQRILLRLEYVTDDGINGDGLCLAAAAVPEIGYVYEATEPGQWEAEGFVFTDGRLAQEYAVQVILFTDPPQVLQLALDAASAGSITLPGLGSEYEEAMVVIIPLASLTRQPASYTVALERLR